MYLHQQYKKLCLPCESKIRIQKAELKENNYHCTKGNNEDEDGDSKKRISHLVGLHTFGCKVNQSVNQTIKQSMKHANILFEKLISRIPEENIPPD